MEPWIATLRRGDAEAAWDEFIDRYRRLVLATIRHLTRDEDESHEVFARVCEALHTGGLARLRRYVDEPNPRARFSTWLVAVVRNQTIDWLRQRLRRQQPAVPPTLSPLQRQIYHQVFIEGQSHAAAYETIRSRSGLTLQFRDFLKEVRTTYAALNGRWPQGTLRELVPPIPIPDADVGVEDGAVDDPALLADTADRLENALSALPSDERLVLQLFVVDDVPAAEVARLVGWRNAKAVYNRVYRCLAAVRESFEREGIRRGDL